MAHLGRNRDWLAEFDNCKIYPGKPGIKMRVKDAPQVPAATVGNRFAVNGTGGVLCIDVDPKNGGSVEGFLEAFPECAELATLIVSTASGVGRHLFYRIPDGFRIRTRLGGDCIAPGVDVPSQYLLARSTVAGVRYQVLTDNPIPDAPVSLLAAVDAGVTREQPATRTGDSAIVAGLVRRLAESAPGDRFAVNGQVCIPAIRELGVPEAWKRLSEAYPGDDLGEYRRWFDSACSKAGLDAVRLEHCWSRRRDDVLRAAGEACRLEWHGFTTGKAGVGERRLLWWIVERCRAGNELFTEFWSWEAAVGTAMYPDQVRAVLGRLPRAVVTGGGGEPWRVQLALSAEFMGLQVTPPTNTTTGGVTIQPTFSALSPVSDVWDHPGLTGWHSLVFDNVSALGAVTVPDLVEVSALPRRTVFDIVSALIRRGLLEKSAGKVFVPDTAATVKGTDVKRKRVVARLRKEAAKLARLREDSARLWAEHEEREAWSRVEEMEFAEFIGAL